MYVFFVSSFALCVGCWRWDPQTTFVAGLFALLVYKFLCIYVWWTLELYMPRDHIYMHVYAFVNSLALGWLVTLVAPLFPLNIPFWFLLWDPIYIWIMSSWISPLWAYIHVYRLWFAIYMLLSWVPWSCGWLVALVAPPSPCFCHTCPCGSSFVSIHVYINDEYLSFFPYEHIYMFMLCFAICKLLLWVLWPCGGWWPWLPSFNPSDYCVCLCGSLLWVPMYLGMMSTRVSSPLSIYTCLCICFAKCMLLLRVPWPSGG